MYMEPELLLESQIHVEDPLVSATITAEEAENTYSEEGVVYGL